MIPFLKTKSGVPVVRGFQWKVMFGFWSFCLRYFWSGGLNSEWLLSEKILRIGRIEFQVRFLFLPVGWWWSVPIVSYVMAIHKPLIKTKPLTHQLWIDLFSLLSWNNNSKIIPFCNTFSVNLGVQSAVFLLSHFRVSILFTLFLPVKDSPDALPNDRNIPREAGCF